MRPNQVNGKLIRHSWTEDERIVICLLRHAYDHTWAECLTIWNNLYSRVLRREGFPSTGLPLSTLIGQVADLKGRRAGTKSAWDRVTALEPSQARKSFAYHIKQIEGAAKSVNVYLKPRSDVSVSVTGKPAIPLQPTRPSTPVIDSSPPTAHIDEWEISSSEDEAATQTSPCARRQQRLNASLIRSYTLGAAKATANPRQTTHPRTTKSVTSGPTTTTDSNDRLSPRLRLPPSQDSRSLSRAPTLLFRAFLEGHGFKSRRILDKPGSKAPPPPPFRSETFREEVDSHLRDYTRGNGDFPVLSPFISLAQNPLNALKRVKQPGLPLSFAVFYYKDIMEDGIQRYGSKYLPYPYLVPAIVTEHELDDLPGNYSGSGEVSFPLPKKFLCTANWTSVALLGVN
jgi:hypothetical protein